ncbi:hypothetical protein AVEN_100169-1 [Araneus ventricosus]|uniref:Uncharacterized protein n=1 Tax=Araneus ventricosus TaxID=182803 RepID=A0A4Y2QWS3_ARAVE|nr:hypothetical protein AVEN_100169-1 [Araneus ventricosus]
MGFTTPRSPQSSDSFSSFHPFEFSFFLPSLVVGGGASMRSCLPLCLLPASHGMQQIHRRLARRAIDPLDGGCTLVPGVLIRLVSNRTVRSAGGQAKESSLGLRAQGWSTVRVTLSVYRSRLAPRQVLRAGNFPEPVTAFLDWLGGWGAVWPELSCFLLWDLVINLLICVEVYGLESYNVDSVSLFGSCLA